MSQNGSYGVQATNSCACKPKVTLYHCLLSTIDQMCYLDFCLKRKTLFLKVNNQSLKFPSFNYDMEFSSVQKFFHRTFSPSRNNLKRNLDFFPHIGVVTPSPIPLPLSSPYLLASTNTFTLTGPEVNIAARIPHPNITFTK